MWWVCCLEGVPVRPSSDPAGRGWVMPALLFLARDKVSTFLFVPYRMSLFSVMVNMLLLVRDAGESLFKKT